MSLISLEPKRISRNARAVVTGAGSGIGQAFAVELAARGGSIVCSDIDERAAQRTVDAITDQGGKALAVRCDVASLDDVELLSHESQSWFGNVPTLVVNNAGIGAGGTLIGDTPMHDWQATIDINLWGVIYGCHVFTPLLRDAGYGGIINVASAASFGAAPRMAAYNVSKAGVLALSETLSAELSGTGVHVTVVCPTFVKTNILDSDKITGRSSDLAATLMRYTGLSAARVARSALNTHDRGGLYVMPQLDAKVGWAIKRHAPRTYTRGVGLLERFGPFSGSEPTAARSTEGN